MNWAESSALADVVASVVKQAPLAYVKFLSANDTGLTSSHQAGIYIAKEAWRLFLDRAGQKGSNIERDINIIWPDGRITNSRFKYYGQGSRNEYRITCFGQGFPFLKPEWTGALFVLTPQENNIFNAFLFNSDDSINSFFEKVNLIPTQTNRLLSFGQPVATDETEANRKDALNTLFLHYIQGLTVDFPSSEEISYQARVCEELIFDHSENVVHNPDQKIINWINTEYDLFKAIEKVRSLPVINKGFKSVDSFVEFANSILNRRKSRAGKSLEHHLAALFDANQVHYTAQAQTEGKKRPDFIFPSIDAYHSQNFPTSNLVLLAAKTTCKDRWRQILNEADRLKEHTKFLCTLQQGISLSQLHEMEAEKVQLVVPQPYLTSYPKEHRNKIWSIKQFINHVKNLEQHNIHLTS